jgi:hypothetical protein
MFVVLKEASPVAHADCLQDLPLKNLGLEGTPHFMGPEVRRGECRGVASCSRELQPLLLCRCTRQQKQLKLKA